MTSHAIRASMLPSYGDCGRRTAAKQYPLLLQSFGYELRTLLPSVGAAIGTAVHAAVGHILQRKIDTGELGHIDDGLKVASEAFRAELKDGAEWDATTPTIQVAEQQVARMSTIYLPIARAAQPLEVEAQLRAAMVPGFELTGHLDLYDVQHAIDDLKTGVLERPYQAQLGGYSLLKRAQEQPVSALSITWIPRTKVKKPQALPIVQHFDMETAERAAFATASAIARDVTAFAQTGDPYVFPTNPMSLMCSQRFCPVWGTKFCTMHLKKEVLDHDGID